MRMSAVVLLYLAPGVTGTARGSGAGRTTYVSAVMLPHEVGNVPCRFLLLRSSPLRKHMRGRRKRRHAWTVTQCGPGRRNLGKVNQDRDGAQTNPQRILTLFDRGCRCTAPLAMRRARMGPQSGCVYWPTHSQPQAPTTPLSWRCTAAPAEPKALQRANGRETHAHHTTCY